MSSLAHSHWHSLTVAIPCLDKFDSIDNKRLNATSAINPSGTSASTPHPKSKAPSKSPIHQSLPPNKHHACPQPQKVTGQLFTKIVGRLHPTIYHLHQSTPCPTYSSNYCHKPSHSYKDHACRTSLSLIPVPHSHSHSPSALTPPVSHRHRPLTTFPSQRTSHIHRSR